MTLQQPARDNRRRLAPPDLRFNRGIGVLVLLIGAVLVYSLVFTPFDERVRFQWEVTPDGGRIPMTHVTCPPPWAVLFHDAGPDVITTKGLCDMPARTLTLEGGIAAIVSILISVIFFTRTKMPGPIHELPFSRDRHHEDRTGAVR